MGDQTQTATTPAAGGVDQKSLQQLVADAVQAVLPEAIKAAVGDALPGAMAEALKPLDQRLTDAESNVNTVAQTVAGQKPADANQVKALVDAALAATAEQTKRATEAQQAAESLKAKRESFARQHLANVPARYHADLGDDAAKFEENAKAVRQAFAAEMKAAGIQAPNVGGDQGGAAVAGTPKVDGFLKMPAAAVKA